MLENSLNHSLFYPIKIYACLIFLSIFISQDCLAGSQTESDKIISDVSPQQDRQPSISLPDIIYDSSEQFSDIESANLDNLLQRIGDSKVVLLGESTHGTAEFYDMRARITRELIVKKGFNIIGVEADWPDSSIIDHFIRGGANKPLYRAKPFKSFPSWMWGNQSVLTFTHWLKNYNEKFETHDDAIGFYGLDIYNLYGSIESVLVYLQSIDPEIAEVARRQYSCLMPWAKQPSSYSNIIRSGNHPGCAKDVHEVFQYLVERKQFIHQAEAQQYFSALHNARLVRNGERFFRTLFIDNVDAKNQRDQNMLDTLQAVLKFRGDDSKAVVWAHNSHIGDARATEVTKNGEINLGQRVRETFGNKAYLIGFGTDSGTVTAATEWEGPAKVMQVRPSHADSYGHLFHTVKKDNFMLPLRNPLSDISIEKLRPARLQRAIGTAYDPLDELNKHYYYTSLPRQFDEYIWFDKTEAVKPLSK